MNHVASNNFYKVNTVACLNCIILPLLLTLVYLGEFACSM